MFKLMMMRYFISVLFLILGMASYGSAAGAIDSMSSNAMCDMFENPECEGFGEFEEFDDQDILEIYDPLSGYNRFMTQVNDTMLTWFFKPIAKGYSFIVREPVRQSFARFFTNLGFPVRVVNNLLQLKINQAGTETARFGVNTTIGFLGFFDPALSWLELYPCPEDFGQTFGYYGAGRGFHLVLPLLGPSNLRDAIGKVPDYFLDPVIYIDKFEIRLTVNSLKAVNEVSLHIEEYETMTADALDLYILLRNAYEMKRLKDIEQ